MYVNDISKCTAGDILFFGDDTSLNYSMSKINGLFSLTHSKFTGLLNWLCVIDLSLNPIETNFITVRPHHTKYDFLINTVKESSVGRQELYLKIQRNYSDIIKKSEHS